MDQVETIALLMGVAWASGLNLYAAVLVLGLLGASGYAVLPGDLQILTDPLVLSAAGLMYFVEFFADKTPGVDTAWDAIHTFIRIPAGAILAVAAVGEVDPALQFAAFLLGGTLAATSHITKASSRALINTSPEPVSNWTASITEDVMVVAGLWAALTYPWVFLAALLLFLLFTAWMLPKLLAGVKRLYLRLKELFGSKAASQDPG
jgi:hypothetical protein